MTVIIRQDDERGEVCTKIILPALSLYNIITVRWVSSLTILYLDCIVLMCVYVRSICNFNVLDIALTFRVLFKQY